MFTVGGAVYENDQLQFIAHEEGRIRPTRDANNNLTGFVYDYFLKDHLGNVRMVLTEDAQTNYYPAATMEGTYDAATNSMVNYEKKFYRIDNTKITLETSIPSWEQKQQPIPNFITTTMVPPAILRVCK